MDDSVFWGQAWSVRGQSGVYEWIILILFSAVMTGEREGDKVEPLTSSRGLSISIAADIVVDE